MSSDNERTNLSFISNILLTITLCVSLILSIVICGCCKKKKKQKTATIMENKSTAVNSAIKLNPSPIPEIGEASTAKQPQVEIVPDQVLHDEKKITEMSPTTSTTGSKTPIIASVINKPPEKLPPEHAYVEFAKEAEKKSAVVPPEVSKSRKSKGPIFPPTPQVTVGKISMVSKSTKESMHRASAQIMQVPAPEPMKVTKQSVLKPKEIAQQVDMKDKSAKSKKSNRVKQPQFKPDHTFYGIAMNMEM